MSRDTIIVCGETGQQGSAVVESLLKKGNWNVVALSRDPASLKADLLKTKGIKIIKADMLQQDSLVDAFKNAYGVFAVTQPWTPDNRKCYPEIEIKQGINIIAACKKTKVKHLIITSMIHLGFRDTDVPHLDSKIVIEDNLKQSNVFYTLFGLPGFM